MLSKINSAVEKTIEYFIFTSRWLQAPVYLGLIAGSGLYLYKFIQELIIMTMGVTSLSEIDFMLSILGLIDISMVMNLLIIVIIGGYSIFTSKIDFQGKEDRPQWINHLDADRLKVKLSTSLASISGVHLLKTFIYIQNNTQSRELVSLQFEIGIHIVFIVSSLALAGIAKMLDHKQ